MPDTRAIVGSNPNKTTFVNAGSGCIFKIYFSLSKCKFSTVCVVQCVPAAVWWLG